MIELAVQGISAFHCQSTVDHYNTTQIPATKHYKNYKNKFSKKSKYKQTFKWTVATNAGTVVSNANAWIRVQKQLNVPAFCSNNRILNFQQSQGIKSVKTCSDGWHVSIHKFHVSCQRPRPTAKITYGFLTTLGISLQYQFYMQTIQTATRNWSFLPISQKLLVLTRNVFIFHCAKIVRWPCWNTCNFAVVERYQTPRSK